LTHVLIAPALSGQIGECVMLNFTDVETRTDEKATDHIEMRVKPSDKERMSHATELTGVELPTFVRASAAREAERVLRGHQATVLSERDRAVVISVRAKSSPLNSKGSALTRASA